jgi:hypothetical protein
MTVGPDDALYVSNFGFGVPVPGIGQVVRIDLPSDRSGQAAAATLLSGNGRDFSSTGADHGFSPPPRHGSERPVAIVPPDLSSDSSGQAAAAALLSVTGTDFSPTGPQTNSGAWASSSTANLAPGTSSLVAQAGDSFDVFGDPLTLTLPEFPWVKSRPHAG